LIVFIFTYITPVAAVFDAGDGIALVLGLCIGFIIICAGLGYYARKSGAV